MTITQDPDIADIFYWPGTTTPTLDYQPRMDLYYPTGQEQPTNGWPIYVRYRLSDNFLNSIKPGQLESSAVIDRPMLALLDRGIAVADVKGAYTDSTGLQVSLFGAFVDTINQPGLFGTVTYPTPASDLLFAYQHLRYNASSGENYGIDTDRIVIESSNYIAPYLALHADFSTDDGSQNSESTRVQGVVVRKGLVSQINSLRRNYPGYTGFRDSVGFVAASVDDIDSTYRTWGSPVETIAAYPNSSCVPFWIESTGPNDATVANSQTEFSVRIDPSTGVPYERGIGIAPTGVAKGFNSVNASWMSAALMETLRYHNRGFHAEQSRLVGDGEYDEGSLEVVADATYSSESRRYQDMVEWVRSIIGYADGNLFDLDLNYDWAAEITSTRQHVQTRPDAGIFLRRGTQTSAVAPTLEPTTRRWKIGWDAANPTERAELVELVKNVQGPVGSFLFRPPGSGGYSKSVVRMVSETLEINKVTGNSYEMAIQVEEAPV